MRTSTVEVAVYFNAGGGSDNPNPEALFERITVAAGNGAFLRLVREHYDEDAGESSDVAYTEGEDSPSLVVFEDGCMVRRYDVRLTEGEGV